MLQYIHLLQFLQLTSCVVSFLKMDSYLLKQGYVVDDLFRMERFLIPEVLVNWYITDWGWKFRLFPVRPCFIMRVSGGTLCLCRGLTACKECMEQMLLHTQPLIHTQQEPERQSERQQTPGIVMSVLFFSFYLIPGDQITIYYFLHIFKNRIKRNILTLDVWMDGWMDFMLPLWPWPLPYQISHFRL